MEDKPKVEQTEKERLKPSMFDRDEFVKWRDEWKDMPEFSQKDLMAFRSIVIHFRTQDDIDSFANLVSQKITHKTKFLWYPETEIDRVEHLRWKSES